MDARLPADAAARIRPNLAFCVAVRTIVFDLPPPRVARIGWRRPRRNAVPTPDERYATKAAAGPA
jgi:hypothetical protein